MFHQLSNKQCPAISRQKISERRNTTINNMRGEITQTQQENHIKHFFLQFTRKNRINWVILFICPCRLMCNTQQGLQLSLESEARLHQQCSMHDYVVSRCKNFCQARERYRIIAVLRCQCSLFTNYGSVFNTRQYKHSHVYSNK